MIKRSLAIILISSLAWSSFAQLDATMPNYNLYVEAGGAGLFYTVNYEQIWKQDTNDFNLLRGGLGVMPVNGQMSVVLPATYSILYCFSARSSIEYGIGATAVLKLGSVSSSMNITNGLDERLYLTACLGYRYQFPTRMVLGARFTPLLGFEGKQSKFLTWGGFYVGYSVF